MKVYFNHTLCKKCPFGRQPDCMYKKMFYRQTLPPYTNLKVIHKCTFYRNIFKPGQLVVIDLYHQVRVRSGRWKYVLARKNVTGRISGLQGCKYKIELFEPCVLERKRGADMFYEASQPARMIRSFDYSAYRLGDAPGFVIASQGLLSVCN